MWSQQNGETENTTEEKKTTVHTICWIESMYRPNMEVHCEREWKKISLNSIRRRRLFYVLLICTQFNNHVRYAFFSLCISCLCVLCVVFSLFLPFFSLLFNAFLFRILIQFSVLDSKYRTIELMLSDTLVRAINLILPGILLFSSISMRAPFLLFLFIYTIFLGCSDYVSNMVHALRVIHRFACRHPRPLLRTHIIDFRNEIFTLRSNTFDLIFPIQLKIYDLFSSLFAIHERKLLHSLKFRIPELKKKSSE